MLASCRTHAGNIMKCAGNVTYVCVPWALTESICPVL